MCGRCLSRVGREGKDGQASRLKVEAMAGVVTPATFGQGQANQGVSRRRGIGHKWSSGADRQV